MNERQPLCRDRWQPGWRKELPAPLQDGAIAHGMPKRARTPSAMARTTGSETAPWRASSASGTSSSSRLALSA